MHVRAQQKCSATLKSEALLPLSCQKSQSQSLWRGRRRLLLFPTRSGRPVTKGEQHYSATVLCWRSIDESSPLSAHQVGFSIFSLNGESRWFLYERRRLLHSAPRHRLWGVGQKADRTHWRAPSRTRLRHSALAFVATESYRVALRD